jgi:hypothetical protein
MRTNSLRAFNSGSDVGEDGAIAAVQTRPEPAGAVGTLPAPAAEKLNRIVQADRDARTGLNNLLDRMETARTNERRAEQRIQQLRQMNPPVREDHLWMREARDQRDRARQELAELTEREPALRAACSALLPRLNGWMGTLLNSGRAAAMHDKPVKTKFKWGSFAGAVERVRRELAELTADLHQVRSAPITAADTKRLIRDQVNKLAEHGAPSVLPTIEAALPMLWPERKGDGEVSGPDALAVLAWLHRDALVAKVEAEVDILADDRQALDDATRGFREDELLAQILDIQRTEEALIEQAEAAGVFIQRRPDADPRAVLGVGASSLPGWE